MAEADKTGKTSSELVYNPSDKQLELLRNICDRYYAMKDNPQRQDAVKEWDAGEKAWDQYRKQDEELEKWQADYYVPLTTSVVESVLSEMVDQSPQPLILPRGAEDKAKATVMKHTFQYTWDVADGDWELEDVLHDALIYGDGFAQEFYWKDRRLIQKLSEISKNGKDKKEKYTESEVFDYDDCYMESVSPYELYFDETARSINRGPYKARDGLRRRIMKLKDAQRYYSGGVWNHLDAMKYVKIGGDTNYESLYHPPEDINHKDEVEVWEYWSRSPHDWMCVVINGVLVVARPNPYKHKQLPFAKTVDVKRPHKFYNKGEPKLLESIQKELNTIRRMIADRNHLDIDKMWLVSRHETYDEADTMARPHGMIRVDDPSNYKPIEYGDIPQSVNLSLQELNKDAVRVTGVEERFQAVKTPGTATEAAILKESTQRRIKSKLRRLEDGFLVDIGRMRVSNILQFYSQPKLERIIGEAGTEEYRKKIQTAQKLGSLESVAGVPFEKKYREIRLQDKELGFDTRGGIVERPYQGFSFFELKPEFFMPVARGGYDIRFKAGSTMPVSKALQAKQIQDMVQQLMPLASAGIGYDPVKLGDLLVESLDQDASDLKIEQPEKDLATARTEMNVNLASMENEQVSKGGTIPELGTPYATPDHTMIHISYIRSPKAMQMDEGKYRMLVKHAMGEITAQDMRSGAGGGMSGEMGGGMGGGEGGGIKAPAPSAPFNQELKATIPGKTQGGEELQGTQKGSIINRALSFLGRKR